MKISKIGYNAPSQANSDGSMVVRKEKGYKVLGHKGDIKEQRPSLTIQPTKEYNRGRSIYKNITN
jgi:hypothetical protein